MHSSSSKLDKNIPSGIIIRAKNKLDDIDSLFNVVKDYLISMNNGEENRGQVTGAMKQKLQRSLQRSRSVCQDNSCARQIVTCISKTTDDMISHQIKLQNYLRDSESQILQFSEPQLDFTVRPQSSREYTIRMGTKNSPGHELGGIIPNGIFRRFSKMYRPRKEINKLSKDDEKQMGDDQMGQLLEIIESRQETRQALMIKSLQDYLSLQINANVLRNQHFERLLRKINQLDDDRKKKQFLRMKSKSIVPIRDIAEPLQICYDEMKRLGGGKLEGIFRLSVSAEMIQNCVEEFRKTKKIKFNDDDSPLVPATMMKHLLSSSISPLISLEDICELSLPFKSSENLNSLDGKIKKEFESIITAIPKDNCEVLRLLSEILCEFSENKSKTKMDLHNLAIVFQPCVIRASNGSLEGLMSKYKSTFPFFLYMIKYYGGRIV